MSSASLRTDFVNRGRFSPSRRWSGPGNTGTTLVRYYPIIRGMPEKWLPLRYNVFVKKNEKLSFTHCLAIRIRTIFGFLVFSRGELDESLSAASEDGRFGTQLNPSLRRRGVSSTTGNLMRASFSFLERPFSSGNKRNAAGDPRAIQRITRRILFEPLHSLFTRKTRRGRGLFHLFRALPLGRLPHLYEIVCSSSSFANNVTSGDKSG